MVLVRVQYNEADPWLPDRNLTSPCVLYMKRPSFPNKCESIAGLPTGLWFSPFGCGFLAIVVATLLSGLSVEQLFAAESATSGTRIEQRIQELTPKLEDYVATGMKAFDVPGVAIVFRLGIKRGGCFVGIFDTPFDGGDVMGSGIRSMSSPPSISADLNPELKKNETILPDIGSRIAVMLFFVCSSEGYFRGAFCTVRIWS